MQDISKILNNVNGFNPNDYAITIPETEKNKGGLYLEVLYRKLWFRLKFPEGKISTSYEFIENMVVATASIYLDKNDNAEAYVSRDFATREYNSLNNNALEEAVTSAVGRALTGAGFNISSIEDAHKDNISPCDAPITNVTAVQNNDLIQELLSKEHKIDVIFEILPI